MAAFGLNARAGHLADRMVEDADMLRVGVSTGPLGETLIDCGAGHPGGIEAGLRMATICMGGLGSVTLSPAEATPRWPWHLVVRSSQPVAACLGSQYAGWSLKHEDESTSFFALGSGPARALARREPLFEEFSIEEISDRAILVLESDNGSAAACRGARSGGLRRCPGPADDPVRADAEPRRFRAGGRPRGGGGAA